MWQLNQEVAGNRYRIVTVLQNRPNSTLYGAVEPDGTEVVIKALKRTTATEYQVRAELNVLQIVSGNPYAVHSLHQWEDPSIGAVCYSMPQFDGNLEQYLGCYGPIVDESQIRALTVPIICVLNDLHQQNIIHGDIKPANVLIRCQRDALPLVCLSDFGLAQSVEMITLEHFGTAGYMAPEIYVRELGRSVKVDTWSLGVTLFQLRTGQFPFPPIRGPEDEGVIHCMLQGCPDMQPLYESGCSEELGLLITRCLHPNPIYRCGIGEIMRSAFYSDIVWACESGEEEEEEEAPNVW